MVRVCGEVGVDDRRAAGTPPAKHPLVLAAGPERIAREIEVVLSAAAEQIGGGRSRRDDAAVRVPQDEARTTENGVDAHRPVRLPRPALGSAGLHEQHGNVAVRE